jgi:uncharacterized protein YutE (UPF0331/DUF86 family)
LRCYNLHMKKSEKVPIKAFKIFFKAFAEMIKCQQQTIYASATILFLHNYIENYMESIIRACFMNPGHKKTSYDERFCSDILEKLSFLNKIKILQKDIPKKAQKKLKRLNVLRNKYIHRLTKIESENKRPFCRSDFKQLLDDVEDIMTAFEKPHKEYLGKHGLNEYYPSADRQ